MLKKNVFVHVVWIMLVAMGCSAESGNDGEDARYQKGTHYKQVEKASNDYGDGKVTVVEYFSYGCPHCYDLEPYVRDWEEGKPGVVEFERIPALWKHFKAVGQAYYTAEVLDIVDKIHRPLFKAIHASGGGFDFRNPANIKRIFVKYGEISPEEFDKTFESFAVQQKMRMAKKQANQWLGVKQSVPTVIVGGKYYTNVSMAGGPEKLFEVVDHLARKLVKAKQ